MHLFLYRPDQGTDKSTTDAEFGPYIAIIPKEFDGHPLSWLIRPSHGGPKDVFFLIDCSPPATLRALNVVADRFWKDWKAVSQLLVKTFLKCAERSYATCCLTVKPSHGSVQATHDTIAIGHRRTHSKLSLGLAQWFVKTFYW